MSKKVTIGLFCDSFFPMVDGVIMVIDNYARRLVKYANVIVFVPEVSGVDYDDSIFPYTVVRCKSLKIPFIEYSMPIPLMSKSFIKQVKQYDLDLVHIHSPAMMGKYGVSYAKKHKIPLIGTMHSQFEQDFNRYINSKKISNKMARKVTEIYDACDECWAVNSEIARIFYEEYGYKELPKVMGNATEMKPIDNLKESNKMINKKYNIGNEKVLLFVGRINKLKNILFIVDALIILKKEKFKFKMLFVGAGQDEKLLKEYIEENDLSKEVILCGKITDRDLMSSLYARADLFLFPSLYDASSLVQIEAACQSTPTVFIEGSATSATVTNMVNGILTKNDCKDYARNIINIMKNKKLYQELSDNCFKDLYKNWDDLVEEVYNRYMFYIRK